MLLTRENSLPVITNLARGCITMSSTSSPNPQTNTPDNLLPMSDGLFEASFGKSSDCNVLTSADIQEVFAPSISDPRPDELEPDPLALPARPPAGSCEFDSVDSVLALIVSLLKEEAYLGPEAHSHSAPDRARLSPPGSVQSTVGSRPKCTIPPPLPSRLDPPGLSGPPLSPGVAPGSRDPESLAQTMLERLAASDYEGALMAANTLLRTDPRMDDALQAAQIARTELYHIYDGRLGPRDAVPHVVVRTEELRLYPLDARSVLVLSQVDGIRTIDDVINSGIMPKLDALRLLSELCLLSVVGFGDDGSVNAGRSDSEPERTARLAE
jgi:hypothetical protein